MKGCPPDRRPLLAYQSGISEAALLERFSAFSACHVREQLAALEAAGLLRGAALEVRAPRLFGSGEAAPLKHYFPAPGVGLGWVAARGYGLPLAAAHISGVPLPFCEGRGGSGTR